MRSYRRTRHYAAMSLLNIMLTPGNRITEWHCQLRSRLHIMQKLQWAHAQHGLEWSHITLLIGCDQRNVCTRGCCVRETGAGACRRTQRRPGPAASSVSQLRRGPGPPAFFSHDVVLKLVRSHLQGAAERSFIMRACRCPNLGFHMIQSLGHQSDRRRAHLHAVYAMRWL